MCGRFLLTAPLDEIARTFGVAGLIPGYRPRYNIAPTQQVTALIHTAGGPAYLLLRWGLVPSWARDPEIGNRMINARAETLTEKKSFRRLFRSRRCMVLADGFYEWRRDGGRKTPFCILLKSRRPFGLAGLWSSWETPEGGPLLSCTIITVKANDLCRTVHPRMPAILDPADHASWLDPANEDTVALGRLLVPYPSSEMELYAVSDWVNNPAHEGERCIERERSSS